MSRKSTRYLLLSLLLLALGSGIGLAADQGRVVKLALVPERNIFEQEKKYRSLCDFLCGILPFRVEFEVLRGYGDVLDHIDDGRADGGVLGSFLVAYGMERHGYVPLARPVWTSGLSHYQSYIFKGAGDEVTAEVKTWRDRTFAMVNRNTSAGYFYPLALVKKAGFAEGEEFFGEVLFSGSHDTSMWMVASGLADLGAAKSTVFDEMMVKRPALKKRIQVLHTWGRFPDATWVAGSGMSAEERNQLREALIGLAESAEGRRLLEAFGAQRFIPSVREDYRDVFDVIDASGFDIRTMQLADHVEKDGGTR